MKNGKCKIENFASRKFAWYFFLCLAFSIFNFQFSIAQNAKLDTQNENIRQAKQRLEEIERLKEANTKNASVSERELSLARNEIGARREIVQNLESKTAEISASIDTDTKQVGELNARLSRLKKDYATQVYSLWKTSRTTTFVSFLLSARDFDDATRRVAFLRRYNRAREQKGREIDSLTRRVQTEIDRLNRNKAQLGELKTETQTELSTLAQKEKNYAAALDGLAKDRKKLEADATAERAKIAAAQKQIDKIMADLAAAAAAEKARAEREGRAPVDLVLSGRFEDNRGRLPWPVGNSGAVLDKFGANRMPDGIVKNSKGITIATAPNAVVRAVFDGKVSGVYKRPEFGMCVVVLTGAYMILYANLAEANVATGQQVTTGQQIGRTADSNNPEDKKIMFQIWKSTTAVDPLLWLRK